MVMKIPVHPGAIVREECLKPFALSISEGAGRLGLQLADSAEIYAEIYSDDEETMEWADSELSKWPE